MARLNATVENFSMRGQAWDHFWFDAVAAGGTVHNVLVNESLISADSQSASAAFSSSVSESISSADSQSGSASFSSSRSESAAVADSQSSAAAFDTTVQESLSASDSYEGAATYLGEVLEACGISDAQDWEALAAMLGGLFVAHSSGNIELALILDPLSEVRLMKSELTSLYLVDVSDPNASPVRVWTSSGVKAVRKKT